MIFVRTGRARREGIERREEKLFESIGGGCQATTPQTMTHGGENEWTTSIRMCCMGCVNKGRRILLFASLLDMEIRLDESVRLVCRLIESCRSSHRS